MTERSLRIVKYLGAAPSLAVCTVCNRQFKVSIKSLRSVGDAAEELQAAFYAHKCDEKLDVDRMPKSA